MADDLHKRLQQVRDGVATDGLGFPGGWRERFELLLDIASQALDEPDALLRDKANRELKEQLEARSATER